MKGAEWMKRYWRIAVLVPFILVVLGAFYISAAGKSFPEHYLKLVSGDEKAAAGITFQAGYTNQSLAIRSDGSEYESERSFLRSLLASRYQDMEVKRLQDNFPSFMRGKTVNPAPYYEDELVLGYAAVESQFASGVYEDRLTVSMYDKKLRKSTSFKVVVFAEKVNQNMRIYDVQMVGEVMHVFTQNALNKTAKAIKADRTEMHLYKLDMSKKQLILDKVLLASDSMNLEEPIEIRSVHASGYMKPNRYTVYQVEQPALDTREVAGGAIVTHVNDLSYYDLVKDKLIYIENESVRALMKNRNKLTITHSQDELVLIDFKDPKVIRVIRYSLAENKLIMDLLMNAEVYPSNGEGLNSAQLSGNRLYLMGNLSQGPLEKEKASVPSVIIIDMDSGLTVYQGFIAREDNQPLRNFMVNNIHIK